MAARNIIRHYVIKDGENQDKLRETSPPRIIKPKQADETESRIIDTSRKNESKQPRIVLHKDDHGILSAIDVTCTCGKRITIGLEYE